MSDSRATLHAVLAGLGQAVPSHLPWPRHVLDRASWRQLIDALGHRRWPLLGLWADGSTVHAALEDHSAAAFAVASLDTEDGTYPSLAAARPAALRLERAVRDLAGLNAVGTPDDRPWLDHGQWRLAAPLAADARPATPRPATDYRFLPVEGEGLHQVPVGPVHAGIIEPGHFRFHANGETIVRLEARLGYTHKGTEALMRGKPPAEAVRLAGRISGDSTVAHALAFSRAVEAAAGIEAPARAHWVRATMAEWERIANHLGDIGGICNDAAFPYLQAQCTVLREKVLQACAKAFGHRLMMDAVVPGGVAVDLAPEQAAAFAGLAADLLPPFEALCRVYETKGSLLDRTVATGITPRAEIERFWPPGPIGRAAGAGRDARLAPGYPPYDELNFAAPRLTAGDVDARVRLRMEEVRHSVRLIQRMLVAMPDGPTRAEVPPVAGEGLALVEAFRGEILGWARLAPDGTVARYHARDASWLQWPLLETAVYDNIVADFPLCNKSFNCSYSGHDL
ncbi:hydrogenase expression protein HypE [Vineibacter terrae]|uniref:Hydrogenase expression protein HypE n=1 Tax=Vineibacter terrae TaxID=2586908 RepID=A0A5C8PA74_9HYPH|nr:nickel-dependent hydrogenase large subunit [Vineibacter terrae]TXL70476.1 hydrogenase expression protein HypE [Vineibacter terrae]